MNTRRWTTQATRGLLVGAAAGLLACGDGDDNGTSPSVTITAPGIVSPLAGSQVASARPTLTVSNVTVSDGSSPTYHFQVATDSGFASIVAQEQNVPQGSGGQTAWQVTTDLASARYFWRARGSAGTTVGPFSAAADFTVTGGLAPGDIVVISDPLTNRSSVGEVHGGEFTDRGWRVVGNEDFIRYEVDAISNGFVQWNNTGLRPAGVNADSHMLFGMWDPSAGGYRTNAYRVHLQKLWGPTHNPPYIRLRWISGGRQNDAGADFTAWDPDQTYAWRIQWGPEAEGNIARVFLDGQEIIQVLYDRPYVPNTHWIELGVAERAESVIDAVYSNVIIGRRQ